MSCSDGSMFDLHSNSEVDRFIAQILKHEKSEDIDKSFLRTLKDVTISNQWNSLGEIFTKKQFISSSGKMVWICPFSIRRKGAISHQLTGIYGNCLDLEKISDFNLESDLRKFQNQDLKIGEIIPVESYFGFGMTGNDEGEAFLVPNGWRFSGSSSGPGINDLRLQRERFLKYGCSAIKHIFEEKTASLLLSWSEDKNRAYRAQNIEFQFHELGHYTGFGLKEKIRNKFFVTPWYAAVEEWRSDGVGINFARKALGKDLFRDLLAANICLRFGTDAHREGGTNLDSDVNSGLILFDRLLQSGSIKITKDFKLSLAIESLDDLESCFLKTSADAIEITRNELDISDIRGLWNLYGSINISPLSRQLFELFIRKPNQDLNCKLK